MDAAEIEKIIKAGVAAEKTHELVAVAAGLKEQEGLAVDAAWEAARIEVAKFVQSSKGKKSTDKVNAKRAKDALAWVKAQKCPHEPMWQRVLVHMAASTLVALIGYGILIAVNVANGAHKNDGRTQSALDVAHKILLIAAPETDPPESDSKKQANNGREETGEPAGRSTRPR